MLLLPPHLPLLLVAMAPAMALALAMALAMALVMALAMALALTPAALAISMAWWARRRWHSGRRLPPPLPSPPRHLLPHTCGSSPSMHLCHPAASTRRRGSPVTRSVTIGRWLCGLPWRPVRGVGEAREGRRIGKGRGRANDIRGDGGGAAGTYHVSEFLSVLVYFGCSRREGGWCAEASEERKGMDGGGGRVGEE